MREIKFRAWEVRRKCFVSHPFLMAHGKISSSMEQDGEYEYSIVKYADCFIHMQYTGLLDKNGVEIYEGDIIEYGKNDKKPFYAVCKFENAMFQWEVHDKHNIYMDYSLYDECEDMWIEVIGNIYENKELLE